MKSFLSLIIFCFLLTGVSFAQENDSVVNKNTYEKKVVNPNNLKKNKLQKPKTLSPQIKSSTENEVKENQIKKGNTDYPIKVSRGTKRAERGEVIKTENSKQNDINIEESNDTHIEERVYEKVEIRKEVKDQEIILTIPNKKRNFQSENIDSYMDRIKNLYKQVSDITYSEKEDEFKIFFNDINCTEKKGLLNEVLIHFQIKEYSITQ